MKLKLSHFYLSTIFYLAFSTFLFTFFWIKAPYNIIFSLILGIALAFQIKLVVKDESISQVISLKEISLLLLFSIILTATSGVGGFSAQNFDYLFHNSKFYDLFAYPLPNYYPQIQKFPCYYFGYWLPVGFITRFFGESAISITSFVWTNIGITLGLFWLYKLCQNKITSVLIVFLSCGILSFVVTILQNPAAILYSGYQPFSKAFLQFLPLTGSLNWVPNQFTPALIATCLIVYDALINKKPERVYFIYLSILYWSPFSFLSITFIYAFILFVQLKNVKNIIAFIKKNIVYFLVTTIAFAPVFLYFAANSAGSIKGFINNYEQHYWLLKWFVFVLLEVWILVWIAYRKGFFLNTIIVFSAICLSLISTYKWGLGNDFCVRAATPFQIIIYVGIAYAISDFFKQRKLNFKVIIFLIGALLPLKYMSKGIITFDVNGYKKINYHKHTNTYEALILTYTDKGASQTILREDSFFYKFLLNKDQTNTNK